MNVLMSVAAGMMLILVPFAVRNYIIERRFSPLPVQGGLNFYIGNNPDADGSYMHIPGIPDSPIEQAKTSIRRAEEAMGRKVTSKEASGYWFSRGIEFIRSDTGKYLSLMVRKFLLFWNAGEVDGNLNFSFCKRLMKLFRLPLVSFGFIAPFAIIGFVYAVRDHIRDVHLFGFLVLTYMIAAMLYFVNSRYRLPAIPYVIILAAYGLHTLFSLIKFRRNKQLVIYFAVLVALFAGINIDMYKGRIERAFVTDYTNLGIVYHQRGMTDKAIVCFQKALEINPRYAEAHYNLAIAYERSGRLEEALQAYKKALTLGLDFDEIHYNIGLAYFKNGNADRAIFHYRKAISINPRHTQAHNNLGICYYQQGKYDEAIEELKTAIAIDPTYAYAYYNMGNAYFKKGAISDAIDAYNNTLRVDPRFVDAHYNLAIAYARIKDEERARRHLQSAREGGLIMESNDLLSPER